MASDALLAVSVYAFVMSLTPGPSNFMLLASGVNFGFTRTIPQLVGIIAGFSSVLLATGLGLGAILASFPALQTGLKLAGAGYLLYLAWRIATSRTLSSAGEEAGRPLTFLEAAFFQWINPKAWTVALTAMTVYATPAAPLLSVGLITATFAFVIVPNLSAWVGFGLVLRDFLAVPLRLRAFNIMMGLLLALSLWPMMT